MTDDNTRPTIGVPKERAEGEQRVALVPEVVKKLSDTHARILVETGAGLASHIPDEQYADAGAELVPDAKSLYAQSDIVAKVRAPLDDELELIREGSLLIAFLDPLRNQELLDRLSNRGVSAFSMDAIPRITRAQPMDALSSMATIAGYKAVLLAADTLGRFFPMLMTAAGTIAPSKVLVLGAGVAGLQALATARRLGAVTQGFDTRPVVKEQVESVGASFIEMSEVTEEPEGEGGYAREMSEEFYRHEQDAIRGPVEHADVVITTAQIPGKPAPLLITQEMVESMRPGSIIVDLAAETGGNCTLTVKGETIVHQDVTIVGAVNLASSIPSEASHLYSRNLSSVLHHLIQDGKLVLDPEDEITAAACVIAAKPVPVQGVSQASQVRSAMRRRNG